jgi:hypothetical protein
MRGMCSSGGSVHRTAKLRQRGAKRLLGNEATRQSDKEAKRQSKGFLDRESSATWSARSSAPQRDHGCSRALLHHLPMLLLLGVLLTESSVHSTSHEAVV